MPPAPAGPAESDRDSHGYGSEDASLLHTLQTSEYHRSPERTSPSSSHERSHRSSPERTSPPRRSERSSRHSSRSSRHSGASEAAEQSEEDLRFVSHQPGILPENPTSSYEATITPASTLGGEKFTAPQPTGPSTYSSGSSRPQALEVPGSRVGETVNSALLIASEQQQPTPQQPANKHPRERNPPGSPVDPSRPATVQSRLPPVGSPDLSRRVIALEEDDDDNLAGGMRGNGSAEAAEAAPLQRSGDAPPKLSPHLPAKVKGQEQQREGKTKPETTAGGALGNSAADILAALASVQAQLQSQEKRLAAYSDARERTGEQRERESQLLDEIVALKQEAKLQGESQERRDRKRKEREQSIRDTGGAAAQSPSRRVKDKESSARPFAAFQDPEYLSRFEILMKAGQRTMAEVAEALEATKERGQYSAGRADAFLKSKATARFRRTLQEANSGLQDDQEPIAEHSKLGSLLQAPGNEDAVDIVVKLRDAHARARAKATHCSTPALGAGNLCSLPIVKNDGTMGRKGLTFLSAVAYAVCEDCPKCTILRNQAETEREWKARKAAEAESVKKTKNDAASRKKRLHPPFKPSDSRIDKTLPRGFCSICKHGWNKGHHLYYCGECNQGIHLLCTDWNHIRMTSGGSTWFACGDCLEARDRAIDEGDSSKEYVVVEEEFVDHELAPTCAEAAGGPTDTTKAPQRSALANEEGIDLERRRDAPPPRSPHHNPPYSRNPMTMAPETPRGPMGGETAPEFGIGNSSRPSYQVKDYFTWEMVPKDWAPKADAPSKYHPEKGYSRVAYQNWRRKNVTLRDQVESNNSSLGPLTRSFSGEMRAFIGKQFLKEPALSWLWPNPVMSEKAIDTWVATDPEFKWVEKIPDPILLELMDKRFGVKCSDLFLSRKFTANLPLTDSFGDVNYHADLFNRWAGEWSTELMELQKAGVNFDSVDLKQTLLNAVSPYKVIHDKAVQIATSSANVLLAALCDWVIEEEEKAISRRNQKESLLKLHPHTHSGSGEAAREKAVSGGGGGVGGGGGGGASHSKAGAAALMTQSGSSTHVSGEQSTSKATQRLLPHLRANGNKVFCRGCSNNWDREKSIPCYKGCKYSEHPDYFADCKDKDPGRRNALTWRGFRDSHPKGPYPQSFLRWEEYEKSRAQAQKRPRDESQRDT